MRPLGCRLGRIIALGLVVLFAFVMLYRTLNANRHSYLTPGDDISGYDGGSGTAHRTSSEDGGSSAPRSSETSDMTHESDQTKRELFDIVGFGNQGDPGHLNVPLEEALMSDLVPADVHFVWCGKRWFEFKNYLSVMSVRRQIQPEKIYIHMQHQPSYDRVYYHQWLDELVREYPWLYLRQLDANMTQICATSINRDQRVRLLTELLIAPRDGGFGGGIYVGPSTWLVNFTPSMRAVDLDFALHDDGVEGYIVLRAGVIDVNTMKSEPDGGIRQALQKESTSGYVRRRGLCAAIRHIYRNPDMINRTASCVIVTGDGFDRFYPADIWELDDDFGRLARRLFYGTERIRRPTPSYDELVPNIGHMIWVGGGRMSYVFYLSILSQLFIVGVDKVYIHGNMPPSGELWTELMSNPKFNSRIKFNYRTLPLQVYQGNIPPWWAALQSDVLRVDLMIKYGGIYTDTDAIWVRGLSHEERGYDAVAGYDWVDWSWPFPDSVNFGISYGKRNAPFWKIFRDSMRRLRNDIHGFTGVMMPYKLLEKYPHLLRIDHHLQVICYHSRCHPTYVKDYHNMSKDHVNMNYLKNWKEDVHSFHWTHPDPAELTNRSVLMQSTGMFAELGRYVLEKAGLL